MTLACNTISPICNIGYADFSSSETRAPYLQLLSITHINSWRQQWMCSTTSTSSASGRIRCTQQQLDQKYQISSAIFIDSRRQISQIKRLESTRVTLSEPLSVIPNFLMTSRSSAQSNNTLQDARKPRARSKKYLSRSLLTHAEGWH